MTKADLWDAARDAALALGVVLHQGALAVADPGGVLDALWDARTGGLVGPWLVRDLFSDRAAFRRFIADAAYAGWSGCCPDHGNEADEQGSCSPCGCRI